MTTMVDLILAGKADEFVDAFQENISLKVGEVLELEKIQVAQNMFTDHQEEQDEY